MNFEESVVEEFNKTLELQKSVWRLLFIESNYRVFQESLKVLESLSKVSLLIEQNNPEFPKCFSYQDFRSFLLDIMKKCELSNNITVAVCNSIDLHVEHMKIKLAPLGIMFKIMLREDNESENKIT